MKKVFSIMTSITAILMVSKRFGNDFAEQNYNKLAIVLIICLLGQGIFHFWGKNTHSPKGD
ncbi:hypothetical protein [Niallia taxi]|uniref:Uncharacterized protein n=1 Tax=Niallia taxi TaxID=2499688 RepID=A0A437KCJ8_9BACI|nr:hypothetical protein [Niallia taxi]MED4054234.1 hypothetical protein [Niallia taxi]MED4118246.1 hypothetical protein [Niallia taxi]RVT63804.1 hypothetical protein EM808_11130 [Niallia taxi]